MSISRTIRALAVIPVLGALALGPGVALADQGESKAQRHTSSGHERTLDHKASHFDMSTTTKDGIRGLFMDNGIHRGAFNKNAAAVTWGASINTAVKNANYANFKIAASNTPLGDATTEAIFNKLADASNLMDVGNPKEAHAIMKNLRENGYQLKKLILQSIKKLFPKK